jgi:hypothetical protein
MHAAIALHPEIKLKYFKEDRFEHPDWVSLARDNSIQILQNDFHSENINLNPVAGNLSTMPSGPSVDTVPMWRRKKRARLEMDDAGSSVSNGSGPSLRVRVRVGTEPKPDWRSGSSINPNCRFGYGSMDISLPV